MKTLKTSTSVVRSHNLKTCSPQQHIIASQIGSMSSHANQVSRRPATIASNIERILSTNQLEEEEAEDWRNGPAKYWYDMINVPKDLTTFDYGFKLKIATEVNGQMSSCSIDSEDAFTLVSQTSWEKQVIWDSDLVRQKVLKALKKPSIAGWIPIEEKRTAPQFVTHLRKTNDKDNGSNGDVETPLKDSSKCDKPKNKSGKMAINRSQRNLRKRKDNSCDNECQNIPKKSPTLPRNEEQIEWVTTLPEENRDLNLMCWEDNVIWDPEAMDRIPEPKVIPFNGDDESVIYLNPDLENNENSNDSVTGELRQLSIDLNISNDEYYASVNKADVMAAHDLMITHSIPASKLHYLCFPTCVQSIIRPILRRSRYLPPNVEHEIEICKKYKPDSNREESDCQKSKDLSKFLIKSIGELTGRYGDLVLMEYCEEDPPLVMRAGMGSQIFNYYNISKNKDYSPKEHRFAQNRAVSESPFIGEIGPNRSQMALETSLSRSPIWEHTIPETDFLVIRTDDGYYIREFDGLFVVGQQLPMREVLRPNSNYFKDFIKQFAKKFIYDYFDGRKFVNNLDIDLQKAFPNLTKHRIGTLLQEFTVKLQSDRMSHRFDYCFKHFAFQSGFRLKSDIPFDAQINDLLTPENCCAYYSTTIAEKRFKDMGYTDRLYLANEECDEKNDKLLTAPTAPWNTTVSYIAAYNKKKWLNVCDYNRDGSLVYSNQSYKDFKDRMPKMKRCQPLSERSIKRLNIQRAHEWLINYGITKAEVKKLRNVTECQELIKELCEDLLKNGVTFGMTKTKTAEQHYKLECQKIYDLHSRVYSKEVYESDESEEEVEEEEEESDDDLEDYANDLEEMLLTGKSLGQIEFEREEKERLEFVKLLKDASNPSLRKDKNEPKKSFKGKALKIYRTFYFNGKKETRTEIVHQKEVIESYVRIRETKTDQFIRNLSFVKNHSESGLNVNKKSKPKNQTISSLNKNPLKTVNGIVNNCHNKTVANSLTEDNNENIDITNDHWDINEPNTEESEQLVEVVGVKIKFAKTVVQEANQMMIEEELREKREREEEERMKRVDYFTPRSTNRMRIDPRVKLRDIFDTLIVEIRKREELDESIDFFDRRVKPKDVPDYYDVIKEPIFLQDVRQKVRNDLYCDREAFLKDIKLILDNSIEYNGEDHEITVDAVKMYNMFKEKLDSMAKTIEPLEHMIRTGGREG